MRFAWVVLAAGFLACSSSSSNRVVRDGPDGAGTGDGHLGSGGNGGDSGGGALDTAWGTGGTTAGVPGRAFGMAQSGRHLLVVGTAQPGQSQPQSARIARYWLR